METKKIKWRKMVTRPTFTVLWTEAFVYGLEERLKKALGVGLVNNLFIPAEKGEVTWYCDDSEFAAFGRRVVHIVKANKDFIIENSRKCYAVSHALVKTAKEIGQTNFGMKSSPELFEIYLQFHEKMADHTLFMIVPLAVERFVSEEVQKGLKTILQNKEIPERFQEDFEVLTTATKLTYAEEEKRDLFKIALEINRNKGIITPVIDREIDSHVEKYCWMPVYAFTHDPWDKKWFIAALKEARKAPEVNLNRIEQVIKERTNRLEELLKDLRPSEELLSLIKTLQEYVYLRTYRTDALRQALYYLQPLIKEVAKRAGMSKDEIANFTLEELEDFLKKGILPDRKKIDERIRHYLLLKKLGVHRLFSDIKDIEEVIKFQLGIKEKIEEVLLFKGQGVYPGVASGEVKIIRSIKDADKMKNGDILVTTMTTPDLHSIIEIAAAIVTDEGGITSHAALVSRELQIPCIIGTEIATRVLKDGNTVKVDSEKGVVEVLG